MSLQERHWNRVQPEKKIAARMAIGLHDLQVRNAQTTDCFSFWLQPVNVFGWSMLTMLMAVLFRKQVALSYNALFGPHAAHLADRQHDAIKFIGSRTN